MPLFNLSGFGVDVGAIVGVGFTLGLVLQLVEAAIQMMVKQIIDPCTKECLFIIFHYVAGDN